MRYISILLFIFLLFSPFTSDAGALAAADYSVDPAPAAAAINAFAIDVYHQLAEESGNLFFSPYSISSALAMAYAGARGGTADEMAKTLHFTGCEQEIHAAMKSLQNLYDSIPDEDGTFSVANRLWTDEKVKLIPDYLELVTKNYGAGVKTVDFLNSHESARLEINDWVAQKTRDKIKDLLQENNVAPDTTQILVNAVYFNSIWQTPFDKNLTKEEQFRIGKDKQREVSMMRRTGYFLYGENSLTQWIKIPYKIQGFSLVIFLPRENSAFTQLEELESKLTAEALTSWISEMRGLEAALSLPKFKDEHRYALADVLQKMGMKLPFTNGADFSGMTETPQKIDSVIHQAFIELDEERTEAAAATAVAMVKTSIPLNPVIEFHVDHPFIYCLTDDTGTILFMGRLTDLN